MPKPSVPATSRYARTAAKLLGQLIRAARKEKMMTAQELAERAGISRALVQRIELGHVSCSIGAVFEAAAIVGVSLFEEDRRSLEKIAHLQNEKLVLLPKSIRKSTVKVSDDF